MFTRINELFVLGGPVEAAGIGGLSGFLAGSIVVLFTLGATLVQRAVAMALLFVILLPSGLNAVRESRA